jgi:acetyltransferase-like isoleucine patch superfamily enzyme
MRQWLGKLWYYGIMHPYYRLLLGALGPKSRLVQPQISGGKRIFIGSRVYVRKNTWLAAAPVTGAEKCSLHIGDGTYIGNFCHIFASSRIEIGRKVLIADKVYISDNMHGYEEVNLPVIDQPVRQLAQVHIGDGAWLGENVCIAGASVGKNSVVGANSVVTKDIPDFCVAAGAPAKIIKRYDAVVKQWRKTDAEGNFI